MCLGFLQEGTFGTTEGATGCRLCGATSTSPFGSQTCECKGVNRAFQTTDLSCVCLPGFHYKLNGADLSDKDGYEPCQQTVGWGTAPALLRLFKIRLCEEVAKVLSPLCMRGLFFCAFVQVFDACKTGFVRTASGDCVEKDTDCRDACGPAGGTFDTLSGLCSCMGEKSLDEVCDSTCREARPQMKFSSTELRISDPAAPEADRVYPLSDVFGISHIGGGEFFCNGLPGEACEIKLFDTTLGENPLPPLFLPALSFSLCAETHASPSVSSANDGTPRSFAESPRGPRNPSSFWRCS